MAVTNYIYYSLIFTILLFVVVHSKGFICPLDCLCYLDVKGRNTVQCKKGGMTGPLTLTNMSKNMEVLKITAPEDNMNSLTMNPNIQSFTKLEEIHITRSNIPILGINFFYGLRKLELLNLSQNNITQLLDHNFRGLENLKDLYLDDNRIISLPSATFRYLKELKVLSIQRNRIQELMPRMFIELSKLRVLKLSGNSIGHLPAEVFVDVKELRVLECRGCSLKDVQNDLYKELRYLTHLDMGDNEIDKIKQNEFELLEKLKCLKLDGNQLKEIPYSAFGRQAELRKLNLARNAITNLNRGAFVNLTNLTELDLGYNKIETIDSYIFDDINANLERLVLSGNRLSSTTLKSILKNFYTLTDLQLADVGLTSLTNNFVPNSVVVLNLAGNHLTFLPIFAIPNNLNDLDISRNHFRGLDEEIVQRIEILTKLKLDNNPWSCDLCHIVSLLERVNRSSSIHDIKCVTPYTNEGRILGTVQKKQLNWCSAPSFTSSDANFFLNGDDGRIGIIAAGASVILLFLTILSVLAALCYSRRHAANYYTHEDKRAQCEVDAIVDNSPLFGEDRELSFKFPLDLNEKKIAIATIDEIKKDHVLSNGT